MFGLETLDLLIGLVTIYLAFGIAATAAMEAISSIFKLRASNLKAALKEMLSGNINEGKALVDELYENPLVKTLSKGDKGKPSYIPKGLVSQVVESMIIVKGTADSFADAIEKMPDQDSDGKKNQAKALFQELSKNANGDINKFKANLEEHFDRVMERSSGWYKRKVQLFTFIVAAILVVGGNLDTIEIAKTLSANPEARAQMVAAATGIVKNTPPLTVDNATSVTAGAAESSAETGTAKDAAEAGTAEGVAETGAVSPEKVEDPKKQVDEAIAAAQKAYTSISNALQSTESSGVQMGWNESNLPDSPATVISKIFGLLISIFAVSLGAPFWFNVLQNLVKLRSTGTPQTTGKAN